MNAKQNNKPKPLLHPKIKKAYKITLQSLKPYLLLLSVGMMMWSLYIFMIGFHNLDWSQNMRWLMAELNITLKDTATNFQSYTAKDGYIVGVNQIFRGLIGLILATFAFASSLNLYKLK